jgi:hypothetical protein
MGDVETKRLRGFEIDHKLEFGRRLDRYAVPVPIARSLVLDQVSTNRFDALDLEPC